MSECNISFWEDADAGGHSKNYDGARNVSSLTNVEWDDKDKSMKDSIGCIQTSTKTWVRVFSSDNYEGRTALINNSADVNMEDVLDDYEGKDMDDTIQSFQLYDQEPFVDTSLLSTSLRNSYPRSVFKRIDDRFAFDFYSQDSQYRMYYPNMVIEGDIITFNIDMEHIQHEGNDLATIHFQMGKDGSFKNSIEVSYTLGEAYQVPDWVITLTDDLITVASEAAKFIFDGAEIVITDGLGVVLTLETNNLIDDVANVLTFCVDHINTVLSAIFKFQDDGGTMNFAAVVCQAISRTVYAYYTAIPNFKYADTFSFDQDQFLSSLTNSQDITGGDSNWEYTGKNTLHVELENANNELFRIYQPDTSFLPGMCGSHLSLKIDLIRDGGKDDHLILQTIFDPTGALFSVIGSIDLYDADNSDDYQAPSSGVLCYDKDGNIKHITGGEEKVSTTIDPNNVSIPAGSGLTALQQSYSDALLNALDGSEGMTISSSINDLVQISLDVLQSLQQGLVKPE